MRTRSWLGAIGGKYGHFSDSALTFALLRVLTDRKAGTQSGGFGGTTRDKWEGKWRGASEFHFNPSSHPIIYIRFLYNNYIIV